MNAFTRELVFTHRQDATPKWPVYSKLSVHCTSLNFDPRLREPGNDVAVLLLLLLLFELYLDRKRKKQTNKQTKQIKTGYSPFSV